jgi:hypothetical protein
MERPVNYRQWFFILSSEEVVQVAVEEALRRLITQIFAGRCRIIVIRRELPRTRSAGWAQRACRIEITRTLLSVFGSTAIRTAFLLWFAELSCHLFRFAHPGFDIHPDSPDKSEQLSPHGSYDLRPETSHTSGSTARVPQ